MADTYGECECGCGERTPLATDNANGRVKGKPTRFIRGHNNRVAPTNPSKVPPYIEDENGCWIWQRAKDPKGYGRTSRDGKTILAHRFYYEEQHGPLDRSTLLHHLCEVASCCNPDHLEETTRKAHPGLHSRVTAAQVREIRESGRRLVDLAREFGIPASYACNIRAGRDRKMVA